MARAAQPSRRGRVNPTDSRDMEVADRRNEPIKRCFIVARRGPESDRIAEALSERGIESLRPEELVQAGNVTEELLKNLATADFVIASLREGASPNLTFELGVAIALQKPTLIFTTNYDSLLDHLHSTYVVKAPPGAGGQEIDSDIDRFLRHAKKAPSIEAQSPIRRQPTDLTWARDQLATLPQEGVSGRGLEFERLIRGIFEAVGTQVVEIKPDADLGADLIVWQNEIAYETGGPILVECKYYDNEFVRATENIRFAVERLTRYISSSDAGLGLIVVGYRQHRSVSRAFDTPRVLTFGATELIDVLERGSLTDEVIHRRRTAASKRGAVIGPD
jgi:hypothetical protein